MHLEVDTMLDPVYIQGVADVVNLDLQRCVLKNFMRRTHARRTTS